MFIYKLDISLDWTRIYNTVMLGTNTDSTTTSEDDRIPPPLPAKHRELESCNSVNHDLIDSPCSTPPRNSFTPPMQALIDKVTRKYTKFYEKVMSL